jgi:putative membrane protein
MNSDSFRAAALAAGLIFCCAASAASLSPQGREFARKAAAAGMDEVAGGRLAQKQASDAAVKQFGERMVTDHTRAGEELKRVASEGGFSVPDKLDKSAEQTLDKLTNLHGHDFDVAYMKHNVTAHEKAVKDFGKEAKSGKDAGLREFAAKTLPTLEEHLRLAQSTAKAVNASAPKN